MHLFRVQDVRLAIRRLRKNAGATIASVVALACGMGASAAAWSLLSAVLLEPLPVAEPDRLFQVAPRMEWSLVLPTGFAIQPSHSYPAVEAIRDSGVFESVAAYGSIALRVAEHGVAEHQRDVYFANHEFFSTLGVAAARGRTFSPDEDRRGAPPVAVLSDRYWHNVFGADPAVLGRTVRISDVPVTVIGILPKGFHGLNLAEAPDLYLPLHTVDDVADSDFFDYLGRASDTTRTSAIAWIYIVGRLRAGDAQAAAAARLNASAPEGKQYDLVDVNTAAIPEAARAGMAQFTTLLSITVCLLLLIGCLTVGMLLLVRTEDRRDELAVSLALGAPRLRLAGGITAEAAILSVLGAALAIPAEVLLLSGIRAFQLPGRIDIDTLELSMSAATLLVAAGAAAAITCLIALLASVVGLGANTSTLLRSHTIRTPRATRRGMRAGFVVGQVATTLVLVVGAGLFVRSLSAALNLNTHIDAARIVAAEIPLEPYDYTAEQAAVFFDDLLARLRQSGSIAAAALSRSVGGMAGGGRITIDGEPREMPSFVLYTAVDEHHFSTVGLPLTGGRAFSRSEEAGSAPVAIVSESFGRLVAGGGDPTGHRVTTSPVPSAEIVGVVPDVITDVNATQPLAIYYPLAQQRAGANGRLVFRAAGDPRDAVRDVVATIRSMDERVTPQSIQTLEEQLGQQMYAQRFGIYVLGTLGGIAVLLTVLGAYVIAQSLVVGRRRELSVRAALGATGAHLSGLVLGDTARVVGIGLLVGLGLAALGASTIRALLYQVEPLDPAVLATACALILGCALLASLHPALAARQLNLTRALREE